MRTGLAATTVSARGPKSLRLLREHGAIGVDFRDISFVFGLHHVSVGHSHHIARDEVRARKHPRHHQPVAVGHAVNRQLDETQRKVQTSVKLQVFGYSFHSLPDPVADNKEKEAPTAEVCGERVVEPLFVNLRVNRPHHVEQRVAVALETVAHLALHIR